MRIDFTPYFRSTIGFDRLFDMLQEPAEISTGFPPYNIERSDDSNYGITLAVAGFAEKDLNVEVRDGVLTVTGTSEDLKKDGYLYQGIAARAFERRFQLAEHVEVRSAKLENGLLHIHLERVVPEEKKPRRIAINGTELKAIDNKKAA
ncbi:MAG TPA: Hsp20 family protein [Rhizomicrobium sp.]|jgi:molecular chaperone IbpA|nr:Hsp20 family protein [Rhizomicrobium sp.]